MGCQTLTGDHRGHLLSRPGLVFLPARALHRARRPDDPPARHQISPAFARDAAVGAAPDRFGQWHALLRSASGYHAFRRVHSSELTPARVAGFLLFNPSFPRSVYPLRREADETLSAVEIALCAPRRQRRGRGARPAARDSPTPFDLRRSSRRACTNFSISCSVTGRSSINRGSVVAFLRPRAPTANMPQTSEADLLRMTQPAQIPS